MRHKTNTNKLKTKIRSINENLRLSKVDSHFIHTTRILCTKSAFEKQHFDFPGNTNDDFYGSYSSIKANLNPHPT